MQLAISIGAIVLSIIAIVIIAAFIIVAPWETDADAPWRFDGTEFKDHQVIGHVKDHLRETKRVAYEMQPICTSTIKGKEGCNTSYQPFSDESCWDYGFSHGEYSVTNRTDDAKYTVVVSEFMPDKSDKSITATFIFDGMTGDISDIGMFPVK